MTWWTTLTVLLFLTIAYFLYGSSGIGNSDVWLQIRLPRLVGCFLVGTALSVSGLCYQVLLNNVLADPYILGLSSGCSLGALIAMTLVPSFLAPMLGAFVGGLVALTLLLSFFNRSYTLGGPTTLTLWGIALSVCFSALTMLFLQLLEPQSYFQVSRWFMGSLNTVEWQELLPAPLLLIGVAYIFRNQQKFTVLSLGPVSAEELGLSYNRELSKSLAATTLIAASAVMIAGPIGFVGLICPHIARLLPPRPKTNKELLWRAAATGPAFLLLCDGLARSVFWKHGVPAGALTAAIGAPFLGYLLWKNLRSVA
jgi:iron complex transport system permease protein